MNREELGSVSTLLVDLNPNSQGAIEELASELIKRYLDKLVGLADRKLGTDSFENGEDIALSAMNSVIAGLQRDRFPAVTSRDSLWPLLVCITVRKARSSIRRRLALKRQGNRDFSVRLDQLVDGSINQELTVQLVEEFEELLQTLNDPSLRTVAQKKLEGYSNQEIAELMGCSNRTIARKLERIRSEWINNTKEES